MFLVFICYFVISRYVITYECTKIQIIINNQRIKVHILYN
ncbi:hypothetical protein HMPREF9969_1432 [Prevotella sp. oral taxon 306 str. F0472]|nr:hypothetical protein HMPREF9969_1432 [Prevotella sp. oral taxon 306 str. F0472]